MSLHYVTPFLVNYCTTTYPSISNRLPSIGLLATLSTEFTAIFGRETEYSFTAFVLPIYHPDYELSKETVDIENEKRPHVKLSDVFARPFLPLLKASRTCSPASILTCSLTLHPGVILIWATPTKKTDNSKKAIVKSNLEELTGGYKKALVLNQFIYWTTSTNEWDYDKVEAGDGRREAVPDKVHPLETKGWIQKSGKVA